MDESGVDLPPPVTDGSSGGAQPKCAVRQYVADAGRSTANVLDVADSGDCQAEGRFCPDCIDADNSCRMRTLAACKAPRRLGGLASGPLAKQHLLAHMPCCIQDIARLSFGEASLSSVAAEVAMPMMCVGMPDHTEFRMRRSGPRAIFTLRWAGPHLHISVEILARPGVSLIYQARK